MQVSVETTSGLGRRMTVQIPADQVDQQVESKLKQLARTVRLDGFRPGKVPLGVVKNKYESKVRQETAGELIGSSYEKALKQENLSPAGQPSIVPTKNEPGQELEFVAEFEVFPEIDPPDLGGIEIEKVICEVTAGDVDNMIEKLRQQRATWTTVERAAAIGDRVEIDFEGTVDGKAFNGNKASKVPLELGSDTMIPGFEAQLVGANPAEARTIEVTFPDDYASDEVAGKAARFEVTVHTVSEADLPDVDDDFARIFGVGDGGVERLKAEISANMERELVMAVKSRMKKQVFDALLGKMQIDVPESLVKSEAEAIIKARAEGADTSVDQANVEDEARRRVSLGLMIGEIFKRNQLTVDPDRVRKLVETLAQSYEKPEEVVQWYYSNPEMLNSVQTAVMEETVVEWVIDQAKVSEKVLGFDEVMNS